VSTLLRHLHTAIAPGASDLSDRELLQRFAARHDETAFQLLLRRHGPMVLCVCRRLLHNRHDAEDAFQATFLVLARKAASVRWRESIGTWLYEVAHRLALEARTRAYRRRAREDRVPNRGPAEDPLSEITGRELLAVLDEELVRLPEKYRAPMVLCCLEGSRGEEAARRLGCSLSTLRRRLVQGRELLRDRLVRRGVALSAAALSGTLLMEAAAPAALPAELARSALRVLSLSARGEPVSGAVSGEAVVLGEGVLKTMSAAKLKWVMGLVLALGVLSAGSGMLAYQALAKLPEEKLPEAAKPVAKDAVPPKPTAKNQPGKDLLGDPLPPGALARLGTSRLRGHRCIFLPDGRRLVRERADGALQIFEIPTGKPLALLRGSDIPGRKEIIGSTIAFTRDGKYLAAVCWEGRSGIWETATGRLVRWLESGPFYSIVQCDFSPDGKFLAVGAGAPKGNTIGITIGVYEVKSGRQLFTTSGTNSVFAPDGRSLVTWDGYRYNSTSTARRVAVPTGKTLATFSYSERFPDFAPRSDGVWFFEVTAEHTIQAWDVAAEKVKHTFRGLGGKDGVIYVRHVPGRPEIIAVGTKPAGMWCWDLETGNELWHVRLTAPAYFPSLSGDGKTLVTGETTGTVRVWDVATGKERTSFRPDTIGHGTYDDLIVSPDSKTIATTSAGSFSSAVALWDAASGKRLSDLPGHPSGITAAAFTADGATVYTIGKDRTLRTWDVASGRELSRVAVEPATNLAVSPDGKTLFAATSKGGSVRVLDARTGRVERQFSAFKNALVGLALTADSKRFIAAGRDGGTEDSFVVRVCDAGTGAKLREFGGSDAKIEQLAVRPDGRAIAMTHVGQRVRLWDADGKKVLEQVGQGKRILAWAKGETPYRIGSVGLSPDGRWLAYSDQEQGVAIVNLRTGHEIGRAKPDVYFQAPAARDELHDVLAFSPDGKTIAWSGVESTPDIFLIEACTHQVRRRLSGDSYPVQRLAFSADGSKLLSAGPDGSALIWDMLGRSSTKPAAAAPSPDSVARWWDRLAETSAEKAYRTMREMADHPSAALPLLREKLKPVQALEAAKLDALIAGLDGPEFKERERATGELVEMGDSVEPRLRAELRKSPSPELKRRAEDALERIEAGRLRSERAIEVLEMIGDAAARKFLAELAGGMPDAARTIDAAGAMARASRTKVSPAGGGR
jgi:RNA polymerase sigma factor (sigma-70 family)